MAKLKAILLNCTLKKGHEKSSTQVMLEKVVERMDKLNVESKIVRVVNEGVMFGVETNMGKGDGWPKIHKQILEADIVVIGAPIWMGKRSSVCQMVIERLDAMLGETNDKGQLPLYNKVGGCCAVGNEDGAQEVNAGVLYFLMQLGATIPPNAEAYWVGLAGGDDDYIDVGTEYPYTVKMQEYMANNLVLVANMLKNNPIPVQGNKADK